MQVTQCHFKFYLSCLDSSGNKDFKLKSVLILKVTIKALCLCGEKIPECSPGLWLEKKKQHRKGDLQFYQPIERITSFLNHSAGGFYQLLMFFLLH